MTVICTMCLEEREVHCTPEQYARYVAGVAVQKAMPDVPPAERELLISRTCGKCWERMFSADEED